MGRVKNLFAPIFLALFAPPADAQQPISWVGQKIVTKYRCPLRVENQVVDSGTTFRIYTVTQSNGDWLWVVAGSIEGWLPANQAVQFDQAIDFYTQEIKAKRRGSEAWFYRAMVWNVKKEFDRAIADCNEAIRLNPDRAYFYNSRGLAWQGKKDHDRAVADYSEAIRLDPKYFRAYCNRAESWDNKGEYAKAIDDYNEAIRLNPNDGLASNGCAWIWATCPDARIRDGKRAVESATRACELTEWKDGSLIDTLAAAHAEAGDFAKAVELQEKALNLVSDADVKQQLEERLALFKARKPYHAERGK
jgi:tetratricopeptide (TPR) repeat protein